MDSDTADTCCIVVLTCSQSLAVSKAIQQRYSDTAINPDTSYLMYDRQGSGNRHNADTAAAPAGPSRRAPTRCPYPLHPPLNTEAGTHIDTYTHPDALDSRTHRARNRSPGCAVTVRSGVADRQCSPGREHATLDAHAYSALGHARGRGRRSRMRQ